MSEFVFPIARSLLSPTSRVEEPSPSPPLVKASDLGQRPARATQTLPREAFQIKGTAAQLPTADCSESTGQKAQRMAEAASTGGRLLQHGQYHLPGTDEDRRIKLLETSSTANIMTTTARTATEAAASVGLT